jgi:hypothetical protein
MDEADVERWFASYLADFIALGRGDSDDVRRILAHYGVPMILSTDAGCMVLTTEEQVLAAAKQQIDGMRSAGYDRSDELAAVGGLSRGGAQGIADGLVDQGNRGVRRTVGEGHRVHLVLPQVGVGGLQPGLFAVCGCGRIGATTPRFHRVDPYPLEEARRCCGRTLRRSSATASSP